MFYQNILRPILFSLEPETAHNVVLRSLKLGRSFPGAQEFLSQCFTYAHPSLESQVCGMRFKNPVGLAAGFDKNCELLDILFSFGFGFLEGGTVTAQPQEGNPKPRIFRFPRENALINRLGFNNYGTERVKQNLQRYGVPKGPIGLNIGKSKATPLEEAAQDYLYSFERVYPFADYVTINVSSPNTPGLRDLQKNLEPLISALQKKNTELEQSRKSSPKPIFVKVAPDLSWPDLDKISEICINHGVTGIIATNTTVSRDSVPNLRSLEGGLSGGPLESLSTQIVRHIRKNFGGKLCLVGVGGILSAEDAYRKIKAGASLLQIYTGWVYGGPATVSKINRKLVSLLERDGFKNIQEAVGVEA